MLLMLLLTRVLLLMLGIFWRLPLFHLVSDPALDTLSEIDLGHPP